MPVVLCSEVIYYQTNTYRILKGFKMPANIDLKIFQGATFRQRLIYKDSTGTPIPLTGGSAISKVRAEPKSNTVLLTFTTNDGSLVLDAVPGAIDYYLDAAATTVLTWQNGPQDLLLTLPSGDTVLLVEGIIEVAPTNSI